MDRATSHLHSPRRIPILTPSELALLVRLRHELARLAADLERDRAERPRTPKALALCKERFRRRTDRIESHIDAVLARTAHQ